MGSKKHINWLAIKMTAILLVLTACGGNSKELIYRVTGTAAEANVVYTDAEGNIQEETVTLPWEARVDVREDVTFTLSASNSQSTGEIGCEVWLGDRKLGDKDSAAYVICEGTVYPGNGDPGSFSGYTGESLLEDAKQLIDKDELNEALIKVEKTITLAPNFPKAYYYQGLIYTRMGKLDLAVEVYGQAISLDPEFVDAYNKRGLTYGNMGEFELAATDFTTTIELAPDFGAAYYGRGVVYANMGELEAARADLLKVPELSDDPNLITLAEQALIQLDDAK